MSTVSSVTASIPISAPEPRAAAASVANASAVGNTESVVADVPQFISPTIKVDNDTGLALLVVRSGDTGKVQAQYPAQTVVDEYRRHLHEAAVGEVKSKGPAVGSTTGGSGGHAPHSATVTTGAVGAVASSSDSSSSGGDLTGNGSGSGAPSGSAPGVAAPSLGVSSGGAPSGGTRSSK